jgi:hypothetical protein
MLHPVVVNEILEVEADVARAEHGRRLAALEVVGTEVLCTVTDTNVGDVVLRFDGARYDAEPLGFAVVDAAGNVLPPEQWPAGLCHGIHPTLQRPWLCIKGCFEFHTFPGHTNEPWDLDRSQIRLTNLLSHVLRKINK